MIDNKITCPKCASRTIYRIPSHQEPMSLLYIIVLGLYLYLILPAIPSKFRCNSCGHIFRRYTWNGWLYLGLVGTIFLLFVAFCLIFLTLTFWPLNA